VNLQHVHIVRTGNRYSLRVGLFKSHAGYQTAEAAGLDITTRDGTGYGLSCFDNLSKAEADRIALKLDDYLSTCRAFREDCVKRESKSVRTDRAKYEETLGKTPAKILSLPRAVTEEVFWRRVEASGDAGGSRFA